MSGAVCYWYRSWLSPGPGDFNWALNTASALLHGQDPYAFTPTTLTIPYPLPVALFGLPVLWLPSVLAAAIFIGASTALLAYAILRYDKPWRLLCFLSSPFIYAVMYAQWSPLIMAAWWLPLLAPLLVIVKPQIALPIAALRHSKAGLLLAGCVFLLSLAIYPTWPLRWIAMLGDYEYTIAMLVWPLGPLLLLSFLKPEGRLLGLMSILPFRGVYDLLALSLIPQTWVQMLAYAAFSLVIPFFIGEGWSRALFVPALLTQLWNASKAVEWKNISFSPLRSLWLR